MQRERNKEKERIMMPTSPEEPLSLELLQEEIMRTKTLLQLPPVEVRGGHVKLMCERLTTSCRKLLSHTEAITTRDAVEACMATVPPVLHAVQSLVELCSEPSSSTSGDGTSKEASTAKSPILASAQRELLPSPCLKMWTQWIAHLRLLPQFHASSVVVRLPTVLSAMYAARHTEPWQATYERAMETTRELLVAASQTFPAEVNERCLPLRSLLPPWAVLTTCAQYSWAWKRLFVLTGAENTSNGDEKALPPHSSEAAAFRDVQERVEVAHADQLSREVLLYSFDSINWKTGNAVAAVKTISPSTWFLFLRCRSMALHGQATGSARHTSCGAPAYFTDTVARRLTARVLHRAVNDIRSCLARNAADMHGDRLEQLTTRDVPCLVLLTRLLYNYVRPHSALATALHVSLVRLVNTAVELRNPLTVDEANIVVDAEAGKGSDDYTLRASEVARGDEIVRAARFLELVWNVLPLQEEEIVAEGAGVPWGGSFPRAAAVDAVLAGRVVVTTVE